MKVKELPSPISLPRVVLWVSGVMFLATPHVCCLHSTSLFQWAESRGAELGRASLRPASEVMPRGVVAECPVGANEPLIVIPRSLILTPSQRLVVGKDVVSPVHYDRATEKEKLAYTLLALLEQKENDAWEGFFSYLPPPEDFSMCAVAWTDEQLGRLASPRLAVAAKNQRERRKLAVEAVLKGDKNAARARKVYWALDIVNSRALAGKFGFGGATRALLAANLLSVSGAAALFALTAAVAVPSAGPEFHNTLAGIATTTNAFALPTLTFPIMCSIALAVVGTRNEIALIPCVDMINHSSNAPRSTLAYDLVSDKLRMSFGRDFQCGDEARFCYGGAGGISNDRLLLLYGFVEIDNRGDTHFVTLSPEGSKDQDCTSSAAYAVLGRGGKILQLPRNWLSENGAAKIEVDSKGRALIGALTAKGEVVSPLYLTRLRAAVQEEYSRLALVENQGSGTEVATATTAGAGTDQGHQASCEIEDRRRCNLAASWRAEKRRLLNEFIEVHFESLS